MKRYLLLFLFLGLFSCDKDPKENSVPLNASKVIGSWQLVETYISPGGRTTWQSVEDGDIYKFGIDGIFSQVNTFEDANNRSGSFIYKDDTLKLMFIIDGEENVHDFSVDMTENNMIITPTGPVFCFEPCLYRYEKLK